MYRPNEMVQMTTPMQVWKAVEKDSFGVTVRSYEKADFFHCNFKTYGGTEKEVNGMIAVEDTATIVCWYHPSITSSCRLERLTDGAMFEILGEPEDIEQRRMVMRFKVKRVKGGA